MFKLFKQDRKKASKTLGRNDTVLPNAAIPPATFAAAAICDAPEMSPQVFVSQASVIYVYTATKAGELTVTRGQIVNVIEKQCSGWWLCEFEGKKGVVPGNYLQNYTPRTLPDFKFRASSSPRLNSDTGDKHWLNSSSIGTRSASSHISFTTQSSLSSASAPSIGCQTHHLSFFHMSTSAPAPRAIRLSDSNDCLSEPPATTSMSVDSRPSATPPTRSPTPGSGGYT